MIFSAFYFYSHSLGSYTSPFLSSPPSHCLIVSIYRFSRSPRMVFGSSSRDSKPLGASTPAPGAYAPVVVCNLVLLILCRSDASSFSHTSTSPHHPITHSTLSPCRTLFALSPLHGVLVRVVDLLSNPLMYLALTLMAVQKRIVSSHVHLRPSSGAHIVMRGHIYPRHPDHSIPWIKGSVRHVHDRPRRGLGQLHDSRPPTRYVCVRVWVALKVVCADWEG